MDPLITDGIDPGLLRVIEKRGNEHESRAPRKSPASPEPVAEPEQNPGLESEGGQPRHQLDDMA